MLALLHATVGQTIVVAAGGTNTYPVKSYNLDKAATPVWYKKYPGVSIGVQDAAACYGVPLSDGGFLLCGAGNEAEGSTVAEGFALRLTPGGDVAWKWLSGYNGADTVIGCNQLPNGGDILVVGRWDVSGVVKRGMAKLNLATGSQVWLTTDFGDSSGSTGAWETIDFTSDKSAALLSGWFKKTDTSPMGYRSGGNTFGGDAVVMNIPVTALTGTTAPTSANAAWTKEWANHNAAHAARGLPNGEIAVLLWTDEDPNAFPKSTVWGAASVTKLKADGTTVWGPINQGSAAGKPNQEGTDLTVSADGTTLVVGGHGYCAGTESGGVATVLYCGKAFGVSASDGSMTWNTEFSSCDVPSKCQTTLIKNECWGIASISDGYVLSCGTGIENCDG
jgi:hypothetical protein